MWEREHVEAKLLRVEYTQKIAEFLVKNQSQISRFGVDLAGEQDVRKAQERMETEKPPNALWAEMGEMVDRQMEEFFCDFVGLYLFGDSFLYAFAYFLCPDFPGERSPKYPRINSRVAQLIKARGRFAAKWTEEIYALPADVTDLFEEKPPDEISRDARQRRGAVNPLIWEGVDQIALDMTGRLLDIIIEFGERPNWASLRNFSQTERTAVREHFYWAVPAEKAGSLANVLNAAWDVERAQDFWDNHPSLQADADDKADQEKMRKIALRRQEALQDLVLKNIEVLEYKDILSLPLSDD